MRTKDLKVGMEVAVNRGSICRAVILEIGTSYTWAKHGPYGLSFTLPQLPDSTPPRGAIAIAWAHKAVQHWQPDVVKLAQIVSTWADYEAGQAERLTKQEASKEKERQRLADFERKRRECADFLGLEVDAASVNVISVPLAQLHRVAQEMKQLREDLQKLRREHYCGKGDKPCDEIILKS